MDGRTQNLSPLLEEEAPAAPGSGGEVEMTEAAVGAARSMRAEVEGGSLRRHRHGRQFGVCYLVYCLLCLLLTSLLLVVSAWEALAPKREARFWRRRLRPWEEAVEVFVGAALCTETLILFRVTGRKRFCRDRWRILDAIVAGSTMLCGVFFLLRRAFHAGLGEDLVEDIDVPMLALRFALQPFRMLATASMVMRAKRLQKATKKVPVEPPKPMDPRKPCAGLSRPALSTDLAAQLREYLPCYLRFLDWELAYSPRVHGTSIQTFYRQQAGANIIVVEDAHGGLFGAFLPKPWKPTAGAYGMAESFVFVARQPGSAELCMTPPAPSGAAVGADATLLGSGDQDSSCDYGVLPKGEADATDHVPESSSPLHSGQPLEPYLDIYWAVPKSGRVIQWSDHKHLGVGTALVVCDDFLHGNTNECETFKSAPLSPAGKEFVIRSFECWHVGAPD